MLKRLSCAGRGSNLILRRALPFVSCQPLSTVIKPCGAAPMPSIDDTKGKRHVSELSGETLFLLAEGSAYQGALRERLRREIMAVDGVEYVATFTKLKEMSAMCASSHAVHTSPYQLGIAAAVASGWLSLPLVFSFKAASAFNDYFVTADPPELGEADTMLEVGSWSWSWMEPLLGTVSFFLLCMQFAREQRIHIGEKPFTERVKERQADLLSAAYSMYDAQTVRAYAESIAFHSDLADIESELRRVEANLLATRKG